MHIFEDFSINKIMLPMNNKSVTSLEVWAYFSISAYCARENASKMLNEVELTSILASFPTAQECANIVFKHGCKKICSSQTDHIKNLFIINHISVFSRS